MKPQDTPPAFSPAPAPGRGLALPVPAEHHGPAHAHRMERFLAAEGDGCEMGHLAGWRVRPTADGEDDGMEQ
jgi:hypothetical protein